MNDLSRMDGLPRVQHAAHAPHARLQAVAPVFIRAAVQGVDGNSFATQVLAH